MRFRYFKDPLFLFCVGMYFVNRCVLKPYFPNEFSRCYLNDVICLPFWVPIMLFLMRKAGLRRDDAPPSGSELIVPLILWSLIFEVILPRLDTFKGLATADPDDILCYVLGAWIAAVFWKWWYSERAACSFGANP